MKTTIYTVTVRIPVRVVHKPEPEPVPRWVDRLMSALIVGLLAFAAGCVAYGAVVL